AEVNEKIAPKDEKNPQPQPSNPTLDQPPTPTHGTPAPATPAHQRAAQWRTAPATDTGYSR
ncbi:hypothetical protein, partial [Brachybacterium muris]